MSKLASQLKTDALKTTRLGPKIWFSAIFFGLIGQIAWIVENMYFATFAQDIFSNSGRADLSYVVTTLMVIFSAITATVTTIFAGGLCDKLGKRKPFISYGYIIWGVTIMLFAAIPMRAEGAMIAGAAALLVIFDCIMTLAGSTSNDAAFNAWVIDHTDTTNRGKMNAVLSMLPVFAVVLVFVGLSPLYKPTNQSNWLFFVVLGAIPLVAGFIAIFLLKDKPNLPKNTNPDYLKETFYGFRPSVIKSNKMLYVTLTASCIIGISQQTFFSYLINFVTQTLGFGENFVLPLAIIIVCSAIFTGICGVTYDKFGRKNFFIPLLAVMVISTLCMYLLKFTVNGSAGMQAILYIGGILMLGTILALGGALSATFQDYIPKGYEGRFQGVRMCFSVLIPMIIGPIISMCIGLDEEAGDTFAPPHKIFLAAAIIAVIAIIPIIFIVKDAKRLRESLLASVKSDGESASVESADGDSNESENTDGYTPDSNSTDVIADVSLQSDAEASQSYDDALQADTEAPQSDDGALQADAEVHQSADDAPEYDIKDIKLETPFDMQNISDQTPQSDVDTDNNGI